MLAHLQRNAVSNSCHVSLDCRCWRRHWWCVSKGKRQHWTWLIDAAVTTFWFGLGLAAGAGYVTAIFLFLPRINSGIWLLRSTKHLHFRLCDTPMMSLGAADMFGTLPFYFILKGIWFVPFRAKHAWEKQDILYMYYSPQRRRRLSPRKPKVHWTERSFFFVVFVT
jgi:hypothetical protein